MNYLPELVAMIFSEILIIGLFGFIRKQKKSQLKFIFMVTLLFMLIWTTSLIAQILFQNSGIEAYFFEKFAAFGGVPISVAILFLGMTFSKNKMTFKWYHCLLFVIPIITIILTITNDYHHLFIEDYSVLVADTKTGPYFMVHTIYSYLCVFVGIIYLISASTKTSGFFSQQSLMLIVGTLIPVILNILGTFSIVRLSVYVTPISYTITILFYALSIFRFKFLSIAPIALQRIVDRMSDGYLVLDTENNISDFNKTFLQIANAPANKLRGRNMFTLVARDTYFNIDADTLKKYIKKSKSTGKVYSFEIKLSNVEKYFNVEVSSIFSKSSFIGTLILFKDITQHTLDVRTIEENQDMLMEKERLASLGQLVGGIAHNLKTPIMSISGAAEGLSDLVREYDASIGDPEVTEKDHHDIANDMKNWIDKIKEYSEYMSNVITAVKGQTVTLVNEEDVSFTVSELLKRVDILMKHELKNALVELRINFKTDKDISLNGDVNSLVQVINNMISNSIQAYGGKPNQVIDIVVDRQSNYLVISVRDYGSGIPENVKKKLFKEMITTKGKNGTGLGLFMSYSTIRGHFNGNITVESKKGEGTQFDISLPLFYN